MEVTEAAVLDIGPYPYPPEFQERALGLALHDRGFYARSRRFYRPEFFTAPHLSDLVRVLATYHEAHRAVPSLEMFPEVAADAAGKRGLKPAVAQGWRQAAERVAQAPPGDDGWVRAKMLEWVRIQTISSTAMRHADLYERVSRNGGPAAHAEEFFKIHADAVAGWADTDDADYLDYYDDLVPRIFTDHNALRTTTGYLPLDEALEGGIDRGELLQFLGLWSKGKSSMLVGMARGCLLHQLRVLVITCELKPRRWAARLDRAILGKTREEVLREPKRYIRQIQRLKQAHGRLIIKGFPAGTATVDDVEALMLRLRDEEGFAPDRLIVDYAGEMGLRRAYADNPRLGIIDVYRGLRAIAQKWDIGVVTAGQTDQAAEGREHVGGRNQSEAKGINAVIDIGVAIAQTSEEEARVPPECRLEPFKIREGGRLAAIPMVYMVDRGVIVPAASAGQRPPRADETTVRYGATS